MFIKGGGGGGGTGKMGDRDPDYSVFHCILV